MKILYKIFVICLMLSSIAFGKSYHFDFQKNIDVSGDVELIIHNTSGSIEIEGALVDQVTIDATKHVRATDQEEAEEVADHIEIRVDKNGNNISVETRYLKMKKSPGSFLENLLGTGPDSYGSVDYKLIVPTNCEIDVENISGDIFIIRIEKDIHIAGTSGNIKVAELNGRIDLETVSGRVELSDITGDIDIAGTSADVIFGSLKGAIDIRATSGNVNGQYVSGSVSVSQTSGKTDISNVYGDTRIKSQTGDIKIQQEEGSLELFTRTGDVDVQTELDSTRDYYVETSSGGIIFNVPETASGAVKLETISGSINTELPLSIRQFTKSKLVGDFGEKGPRIYLMTASGDITLGQF
ncbi:MAG: DUF4097 domain-containing protein [candidate division Zixibacteria bacterium]|nr:DUF4097 domain-containing protein [candidate division Zixibacteria bacterium]